MSKTPLRYLGKYAVGHGEWSDMAEIADLERQVFVDPMSYEEITEKYYSPNVDFLVVKEGTRVIAYFGFEVFHRYAHVLANVTHPQYRRQGLGAFVLKAAEPWAYEMGALAFIGEVRVSNVGQLRVLESIGWTRVALIPQFFSNGEDAQMVLRVFT